MNIEIANRLVNLRKQNNLSQEALAEKLGLSRQAVSKWERAEASPDTDNLILLARLYGVSLDELLQTDDEIPVSETASASESTSESTSESDRNEEHGSSSKRKSHPYTEYLDREGEFVHVGFDGVHVREKNGKEVHVGWKGIYVEEDGLEEVHVDGDGVYVKREPVDVYEKWEHGAKHVKTHFLFCFPMDLLVVIAYISYGMMYNIWHPTWIIFFAIPIWHSLVECVVRKNAAHFAYPLVTVAAFLYLGLTRELWHPAWCIFLTIPVYYGFVNFIKAIIHSFKKQ